LARRLAFPDIRQVGKTFAERNVPIDHLPGFCQ